MNTYDVTVTRCGRLLATVRLDAVCALAACHAAERKVQGKRRPVQMVTNGKVQTVYVTGLETMARQVVLQ